MASWTQHSRIQIGKYVKLGEDKESVILLHLMYNNTTDKNFACQVEFIHPSKPKTVELARIDRSHGFQHLDKLWKKEPDKEEFYREMNPWEAAEYLQENWISYFKKWSNRDDTEISRPYELIDID
jgi:hypothetical protein